MSDTVSSSVLDIVAFRNRYLEHLNKSNSGFREIIILGRHRIHLRYPVYVNKEN